MHFFPASVAFFIVVSNSPETQAKKVVSKAKDEKPSPRRKYSNKRKSQGKEDRVNPQTHNLRKLKGKKRKKNAWGEKGKESHLPHQMFKAVTPQQTRNQRLQLLIKDSN